MRGRSRALQKPYPAAEPSMKPRGLHGWAVSPHASSSKAHVMRRSTAKRMSEQSTDVEACPALADPARARTADAEACGSTLALLVCGGGVHRPVRVAGQELQHRPRALTDRELARLPAKQRLA
eukprot:scaffold3139_cov110-Isochrysis_galbana.AAC.9